MSHETHATIPLDDRYRVVNVHMELGSRGATVYLRKRAGGQVDQRAYGPGEFDLMWQETAEWAEEANEPQEEA